MALLPAAVPCRAANLLRSGHTVIEAPDGMVYDSALSAKMAMDVYTNADHTLSFALGRQERTAGISAVSLAAVIARRHGSPVVKVSGKDIYAAFDDERRHIYCIAQTDSWLPIVLIIGNIDRETAMRYIASLRAV